MVQDLDCFCRDGEAHDFLSLHVSAWKLEVLRAIDTEAAREVAEMKAVF